MKLPEGAHLAYIVWHEAWYAEATRPGTEHPHLMIEAMADGGGCHWEFQVDGYDLSGPVTRVKMFSDSYEAFEQIPEFFAALRPAPRTLDEVRSILDGLGAVDETPRENPYKDPALSLRERIIGQVESVALSRSLTPDSHDQERIADAVLAVLPQDDES